MSGIFIAQKLSVSKSWILLLPKDDFPFVLILCVYILQKKKL